MFFKSFKIHLASCVCLWLAFSCDSKSPIEETPPQIEFGSLLEQYVQSPDSSFRYEIVHQTELEGFDYVVLKMISQHWLSKELVDETEWWHWVSILIPKDSPHHTGMMWIGGGSRSTKLPTKPNQLILAAATQTNSVVAQIHNVPFQPLTFADDDEGERTEDAIIAYGWRKFLEGGAKDEDAIWLARFPMTKAVKLAMDAVSEVVNSRRETKLETFLVAGASKRGWTTWTTAATDDRVVAIAPVVIDMLNLEESFVHHWKNYGFWAPAVGNYVSEGVMEWLGTPEFDRLLELTEPYSFIDSLRIPKLLINAAGDQFFQPDSWEFYWKDLQGEKHMQYVPNFGHDLSDSDAFPNLIAFYASILNQTPRPNYEWEVTEDQIVVKLDPDNLPKSVKLWSALNPLARDFRIDEFGPNWVAEDIPIQSREELKINLIEPQEGYRAYFVEMTFVGQSPLKVTSGVEVVPRTYPFEAFEPSRNQAQEN